eukprot:TRINITY_DN2312_c0_g1_i10.p1 TRINITY_DN2312_c0_g1~~TRINITY_DN2312_c0_g1_i10.p1  ORF type:complete len:157 (+),score=26.46 TRINITY_DN2312_c0_g1_i10:48-518(+)
MRQRKQLSQSSARVESRLSEDGTPGEDLKRMSSFIRNKLTRTDFQHRDSTPFRSAILKKSVTEFESETEIGMRRLRPVEKPRAYLLTEVSRDHSRRSASITRVMTEVPRLTAVDNKANIFDRYKKQLTLNGNRGSIISWAIHCHDRPLSGDREAEE